MSRTCLLKITHGSHLYGTNTPSSDQDYKAVFVASAEEILLGNITKSQRFNSKHERESQVNGKISRNLPDDIDVESLEVGHFFDMLINGQMMALDMLFCPPQHVLNTCYDKSSGEEAEEFRHYVWDNRFRFITKKIDETTRYINTQANKYGTKGSRVAECRRFRDLFFSIMQTAGSQTKVADIGEYITALTQGMDHSSIIQIKTPNNTELNHLLCVGKKIPFTVTVKEAYSILDNFMQKYGQRALDAENNQGVDWKALSHAVRVSTQALELLNTGNITFPRPDAELLKTIKRGDMHFKEVSEMITDLTNNVKEAAVQSPLASEADLEFAKRYVYQLRRRVVMKSRESL